MATTTVNTVRVGTFNIGVDQQMLRGKSAAKYLHKIDDILATCVSQGCLDIMWLSELGGHRQGMAAANIRYHVLDCFKPGTGPRANVNANYLTSWNFNADATQLGVQEIGAAEYICSGAAEEYICRAL